MAINKNHKFPPAFLIPIQFTDGIAETNLPLSVQLNRESVKLLDIVIPIAYKDEKGNESVAQRIFTINASDLIAAATSITIAAKE